MSKDLTLAAATIQTPESLPHDHFVQFYDDESALSEAVAAFLAEGLRNGQSVVVIATAEHAESFRFALAAHGVDGGEAVRAGQMLILDAHDALALFMVDNMPDEQLFITHLGGAIAKVIADSGQPSIRAYGEMVDILWREGNATAAIRLEELWNDLAAAHSFALLCAYAMGNFYHETSGGFEAVCKLHSHVIPARSEVRFSDQPAPYENQDMLEQRAIALANEVEHRVALEHALRAALADRRRAEEALRRDIAEREQIGAELRLAKEEAERAHRVKSEFLAVMTHELRTPLNAIMGYQQLLFEGVSGPVTVAQKLQLERIRHSASHLLSMIDNVLTAARIEAGRLDYRIERVTLEDTVRDVLSLLGPEMAENALRCSTEIVSNLFVHVDRDKLQQILLNVVGNAVKFTPPGGTITVRAASTERLDEVLLRVSDTGPGVPEENQQAIFEPFVQLDTGRRRRVTGAGLGLSISRDFARGMGGDLTIESEAGKGATFVLKLRRAR
jgi:signal transduction histidine kinase